MHENFTYLFLVVLLLLTSCSKDPEVKPDENKINHEGEKWKINSAEYTIIDQSLSSLGQGIKTGTISNAGAFYFNNGKGSFDISIDSYHKEDVFSVSENTNEVSITSIAQNLSAVFSQNVIAFSGEKDSPTSMTLNGSITKQSMTGQFVMSGKFILVKE